MGQPLTDLTIRKFPPPDAGQVTHWDDALPGFGLRLSPGGTRTFVLVHGRDRRRTTIGRYPIISLAEARAEAKRILAQDTLGMRAPPSMVFDEAVTLFVTTHCQLKNKPATAKETARLLNRVFLPRLHGRPLSEITTHDLNRVIDRRLATPSAANHAFTAARTFFRWAVRRRYISHSPLEGLSLPAKAVSRERVLTAVEVVSVWRAAERRGYPYGVIVRLLMLTGQRRAEIANLKFDWIDQRTQTITLPKEIVKNNRSHTFPYGPLTAAIIDAMPRMSGSNLLFPARGNSSAGFSGWSKSKAGLEWLPPIRPWVLHDLRRTVATELASLGVQQIVVEKLLNHVSGGSQSPIAQIYNRHAYLDEMRAAICRWEEQLATLLAG